MSRAWVENVLSVFKHGDTVDTVGDGRKRGCGVIVIVFKFSSLFLVPGVRVPIILRIS